MVDGVLKTLEELKLEAENFGLDLDSFLSSVGAELYQGKETGEKDFQEGVAVQMDATVAPEVPDASEEEKSSIWDYISGVTTSASLLSPITALPTLVGKGISYYRKIKNEIDVSKEQGTSGKEKEEYRELAETFESMDPMDLTGNQIDQLRGFARQELLEQIPEGSSNELADLTVDKKAMELFKRISPYGDYEKQYLAGLDAEGSYFDFIGDVVTYVRGGIATGGTVDPLIELTQIEEDGSYVNAEEIEKFLEASKAQQEIGSTNEMRKFETIKNRALELGASESAAFFEGIMNNPSAILGIIAQSFATQGSSLQGDEVLGGTLLAAGGGAATGAALGTLGGPLAPITSSAGAISGSLVAGLTAQSAIMVGGLTFGELVQEHMLENPDGGWKDGPVFNTENLTKILSDNKLVEDLRSRAIKKGITVGIFEGMLGAVTGGVGGKIAGTGLRVGKKVIKSAPLGTTVAGIGESATGMGGEYFGRKAAGQENDFSEVLLEGIGGKDVVTGPLSFATQIGNVNNLSTRIGINNELANGKYKNIADAFRTKAPSGLQFETQINIASKKGSAQIVDQKVDNLVKQSRITIKQGENIKTNFRNIQGATNVANNLNITGALKQETVNLVSEKIRLDSRIAKAGKNKALVSSAIDRVKEIDSRLSQISAENNLNISVQTVTNLAENVKGLDVVTVDNKQEAEDLSNDPKFKNVDKKSFGEQGFILQNKETGEQTIVINKYQSNKDLAVDVANHEFLHALLFQTLRNSKGTAINLGKELKTELFKIEGIENTEFAARLEQYKADPESVRMEEVLTLFSGAIQTGDIKFNEGFFTKVGDVIRRFLQNAGLKNVKFNKAEDVYNFIKDYNTSLEKGKLTKAQEKLFTERADGDLVKREYKTKDDSTIKESKSFYDSLSPEELIEVKNSPSTTTAQESQADKALTDQFDLLALSALNYDTRKGDIDRNEVIAEARLELPGILERFDPETAKFSTFVTNTMRPKQAQIYEKAKSIQRPGESLDSPQARQIASEESVISEKVEVKETKINPLNFDKVNKSDVESVVDIKVEEIPGLSFKEVSDRYAGKVASKIFNVPESKITDPKKNLTYAKKIVNGIPEKSEAGNIQEFFRSGQNARNFIRILPPENVSSSSATINEQGENIEVSRDVLGRALGLNNRLLNYFYNKTGKRSKGKTSQPAVWELKQEFKNPTTEVVEKFKTELGITPKGELNLYDRNIGQLLKGTAKLQGQNTANVIARDKIKQSPVKTAKPTKQIIADVASSKSRVMAAKAKPKSSKQTSSYVEQSTKQVRSFDKVSKTKQREGKKGRAYDRDAVLPESVRSFKGETVIQGFNRTLNNFSERFPGYNTYFKNALVFGETRSPYGVVARFKEGVKSIGRQFDIRRTPITKDRKITNAYAKSIFEPGYVAKEKAKLNVLKDFYLNAEAYLKDNPKDIWIFDEIASAATNSQNSPNRALAPALIVQVDADGNPLKGVKGIEEHTEPQNNIGTMLTQAAKDGRVKEVWPIVEASYMQGWIDLDNNDLLDVDFKMSMPEAYYKGVELYKDGKLKLDQGLLSTIRLSEAGIDLSSMMYIPTKQTLAEYFFETNEVPVELQKSLMNDLFSGDKTLREIKDEALFNRDVTNRENETFKPDAKKVVVKNNKADKAMSDARNSVKYSENKKKARVFDFDDTLAQSNSKVIVNMPDGTSKKISATEFATDAQALLDEGAEFDFTQFNKVIDGKKGPLFEVAKTIQDKRGSEDLFILTARPQAAALNIKEFLEGLGLNIPLKNITGLADGRPEAKADWFVDKYSEGYNDFYFADDALKNVKAVKEIFNVLDVKSRVQQARVKFSKSLDSQFNKMIERNKGVKANANFSDINARRKGRNQKRFAFFIPPSADDFRGLTMYTFAGKGKQGEADQAFFDKALIKPYMKGINAMEIAKQRIRKDYNALIQAHPVIKKQLNKKFKGTKYTTDEATRIFLWDKEGFEIPGLSKTDQKDIVKKFGKDVDLVAFSEGVKLITRLDQFVEPTAAWDGTTIIGDLSRVGRDINRAEFLKEFTENVDKIFSDKNLNKIEALYGFRIKESLINVIDRMKTGSNSPTGQGRIVTRWNNWVNNSTGAIMFFNRRSALLQLMSSVNFVNWSDNNPLKAGLAFANQPQYWSDVAKLFNSDKLKQRRSGLQSDIQEAEIAQAAKNNGMEGVISYILKIGFTPTQVADSIAIATGGATFYRNRVNTYKKAGFEQAEAESKAFEDFSAISDETQQSADPMLISGQQSSVLGRLVLAFQNTPMQYTRLMKKAGQDLINGRGDRRTNLSKIVYYGFVQNLVFATLQNALFALLPGFEDEDEDFATDKERDKAIERKSSKIDNKIVRAGNGMVDTVLRGSGLAGAVVSTVKNLLLEYNKQQDQSEFNQDNAQILIAALNISPPIGSKVRKINNFLQTKKFDKDVIAERGFDVMIDGKFQLSPSYDMIGELTSATLNLPLDRLFDEVNSLTEALDSRNTNYQRIALGLGWRQWDVNARSEEHDLIKIEAKAERKIKGKEKSKITREENKQKQKEYNSLRRSVLRRLPSQSIRDSIYKVEKETNIKTPMFKLKELQEKHGI